MRKHPVIRNVVLPAAIASIFLPFSAGAGAATSVTPATHAVSHTATAGHQFRLIEPVMSPATVRVPLAVTMLTKRDFEQWGRVNICEESGDWHVIGSKFSGGLGISNVNWIAYGGRQFAWNGAYATPAEQIVVAKRIQQNPPDQFGCAAW
ncbi:MAG: transglycosylase family protein [Actinomycetota bacterium]